MLPMQELKTKKITTVLTFQFNPDYEFQTKYIVVILSILHHKKYYVMHGCLLQIFFNHLYVKSENCYFK